MHFDITEDGTMGPFKLSSRFRGDQRAFSVGGTWDTATVEIQLCGRRDGVFVGLTDGSFTDDGLLLFSAPPGCYFQVVTSSAGGSTDLKAALQ